MQLQSLAMGNAFANWSDLTDEYMAGMQALRRREPGASARMMEIAKLMNEYQQVVGGDSAVASLPQKLTQIHARPPAPRPTHWLKTAAATLFRTSEMSTLENDSLLAPPYTRHLAQ